MYLRHAILVLCLMTTIVQAARTSNKRRSRNKHGSWGNTKDVPKRQEALCGGSHQSQRKPYSVNRLKFGDFDVIGAMGDSVVAGTRALAQTFEEPIADYRGRSFVVGGDLNLHNGVSTLPNILREFNPDLRGFSTGSGDVSSAGANLNRAVPGSMSVNMTDQARDLIQKIRDDPEIDFINDWKLVSIAVGGNDLCLFCWNQVAFSAAAYIFHVKAALDILKQELPRTYVNLLEIQDIATVVNIPLDDPVAEGFLQYVCPCGRGPTADQEGMTALNKQYNEGLRGLVSSGKYDTDSFTVVLQPYLRDNPRIFKPNGEADFDFISPDGFHPNGRGQNILGIGLWNNMIEPVGFKSTAIILKDVTVQCPESRAFVPTNTNVRRGGRRN